jgi:hypothetical protein
MKAREALTAAARHGVEVRLDGENLTLEAATAPPDTVIAAIKQNKSEIVALLRAPTARPAPRIVKEPPFGCDNVPARYVAVWEALLAQRPPGVTAIDWEIAIYSAAALFGDWGGELVCLGWPADAIFSLPSDGEAGLAWYLGGQHVVFLGPERAFLETGLIFDRKQMTMQLFPREPDGEGDSEFEPQH